MHLVFYFCICINDFYDCKKQSFSFVIRSLLFLKSLPQNVAHSDLKLLVSDNTIAILIGLHQQVLPQILVHPRAAVAVEQIIEIIKGNVSVPVGVHDPERALEVFFVLEDFAVDGGGHELLEIDDAVAIVVALVNDFVPVDVVLALNFLMDHLLKFPLRQRAIPVFINSYEFSLQSLKFFLRCTETR